jgi:hypothetical protein
LANLTYVMLESCPHAPQRVQLAQTALKQRICCEATGSHTMSGPLAEIATGLLLCPAAVFLECI